MLRQLRLAPGNQAITASKSLATAGLRKFDRTELRPAAHANLRTLAQLIGKTHCSMQRKSRGDAIGDDIQDLDLSELRAGAVKAQPAGNRTSPAEITGLAKQLPASI